MAGKRTSAAKKAAGIKSRITAKQKVARQKNIAIARKSKKKGKDDRARDSIKVGMALDAARMGMRETAISIGNLSYKNKQFREKRGRDSKQLIGKINKLSSEYKAYDSFYKKYKNRTTK